MFLNGRCGGDGICPTFFRELLAFRVPDELSSLLSSGKRLKSGRRSKHVWSHLLQARVPHLRTCSQGPRDVPWQTSGMPTLRWPFPKPAIRTRLLILLNPASPFSSAPTNCWRPPAGSTPAPPDRIGRFRPPGRKGCAALLCAGEIRPSRSGCIGQQFARPPRERPLLSTSPAGQQQLDSSLDRSAIEGCGPQSGLTYPGMSGTREKIGSSAFGPLGS